MKIRSLALMCILPMLAHAADQSEGRIMRPSDHAAILNGEIDIIATAPEGRIEIDGHPVTARQPFPNVFHASEKVDPGIHTLTLKWAGGESRIRFSAGPGVPAGFAVFHQHPPVPGVECTECHELNKRGRFHFKGGCFDCHQTAGFEKIHTHTPDRLSECGMCHNAHGSTMRADLIYPKQTACRQCHD